MREPDGSDLVWNRYNADMRVKMRLYDHARERLLRLCHHEAAHAVAAVTLGATLSSVNAIKRPTSEGAAAYTSLPTEADAMVSLAGPLGEQRFLARQQAAGRLCASSVPVLRELPGSQNDFGHLDRHLDLIASEGQVARQAAWQTIYNATAAMLDSPLILMAVEALAVALADVPGNFLSGEQGTRIMHAAMPSTVRVRAPVLTAAAASLEQLLCPTLTPTPARSKPGRASRPRPTASHGVRNEARGSGRHTEAEMLEAITMMGQANRNWRAKKQRA